jgi:hypothetical protein
VSGGQALGKANASAPGIGSVSVNPSDTVVYDPPIRSLRCTGAGSVTFVGYDGVEDTWEVQNFDIIPVMMTKVKESTTATGLKGIR